MPLAIAAETSPPLSALTPTLEAPVAVAALLTVILPPD